MEAWLGDGIGGDLIFFSFSKAGVLNLGEDFGPLPAKEHLTKSGHVLVVTTRGRREAATSIWWREGRVTVKHPIINTLAPVAGVSSGEVEKPWCIAIWPSVS